ncbi:MAG: hypothetical protein R6V15_08325 [Desulfotignum sp.]
MPEEKKRPNQDRESHGQSAGSFYGARKSRNEIYFQIASVFREVSQDDTRLAKEWMHRIIMDSYPKQPDNADKIFVNSREIR